MTPLKVYGLMKRWNNLPTSQTIPRTKENL